MNTYGQTSKFIFPFKFYEYCDYARVCISCSIGMFIFFILNLFLEVEYLVHMVNQTVGCFPKVDASFYIPTAVYEDSIYSALLLVFIICLFIIIILVSVKWHFIVR